jgi:hypothetical protein
MAQTFLPVLHLSATFDSAIVIITPAMTAVAVRGALVELASASETALPAAAWTRARIGRNRVTDVFVS